MTAALTNAEIELLIDKQIELPSPPAIAVRILNAVQEGDSSLFDLERIISADPALTGKLLKLANSAFYSLPQKVSNISRALSILGTNVIKNIALSFVITNELRGDKSSFFDFDYFWRRSVTTAVSAELICTLLQKQNDDIFVTALLQDIGILTMYMSRGKEYANILNTCQENGGTCLSEMERNKYQFDHQQLGHILLESWNIPQSVTIPMYYHHEPERAPAKNQETARILCAASLLSAIYHSTETSVNVREFQNKMADYFNIAPEQTKQLLDDVVPKSIDILQIFEVEPGEMKPFSQILQEANDELGKLNLSYEQLVLELKESKEKTERFANNLRKANARLEELAFRDGLTNLFNHRYFQEILSKEIARAKRYNHSLSLIMFDIDFFKLVNDTYGHPAGDQVLKDLAQSTTNAVRPSDIIARYGGEEFMIILPETNESGLKVFAERLRRFIASMTTIFNDVSIKITISSGGTHFLPAESEISQQDLIDTADRGLYLSKKNGRNRTTILSATQRKKGSFCPL